MMYKLIIFDVDGTLGDPPDIDRRPGAKLPARFRKTPDDWQLFSGRKERIAELHAKGIKTALATNEGGVAFGYLDEDEMAMWLLNLYFELGMEGNFVCFNHPHGTLANYRKEDYDRKPHPGMLFRAMALHFVYPRDTLYVGDRDEDRQAADNAGCDFLWAEDFFEDK
jgi:D-glycero-D-manno-heptose 1,7-bisphosphate phosphatase